MACFIVCNMFPPEVSPDVRAPGLRAEQLFHQAKQEFDEVYYIMFKSRFDLLTKRRNIGLSYKASPNFLVIHNIYLERFLDRTEPSTFIFTQVEFFEAFKTVRSHGKHKIVYDILAPKALELKCAGASEKKVGLTDFVNGRMISQADRVFVNGQKNRDLYDQHISQIDSVFLNPLTPVRQHDLKKGPSRDFVFFFGTSQKWTDNSYLLEHMSEFLAENPDVKSFVLTPAIVDQSSRESIYLSRLYHLPNVRMVWNLSYESMLSLLMRSYAILDWSVLNEERHNSTSTRLIQAVSYKCPIMGNSDTGLDYFWPEYPGVTLDTYPTYSEIDYFISEAKSGAYKALIEQAQERNEEVLGAGNELFEGLE